MVKKGYRLEITDNNFRPRNLDTCTLRVGDWLEIAEVFKSDDTKKVYKATSNLGYSYVIKGENRAISQMLEDKYFDSPYVTPFLGVINIMGEDCNVYECMHTSLDKMPPRQLSYEEKDIVFLSCLRGVRAFAKKDMFYSDLKPGNITVTLSRGKIEAAKLCDFDAMYQKTSATEARGTPPWCSPRAFENETNSVDVIAYPLAMLLYYLYTDEVLWGFIGMNPPAEEFEKFYCDIAMEQKKIYESKGKNINPRRMLVSYLWNGEAGVKKHLHSNGSTMGDSIRKRISKKIGARLYDKVLTDMLTEIICGAMTINTDGSPAAFLNEMERKYCEFTEQRSKNSAAPSESLVLMEIYRGDKPIEHQCFYLRNGESINVPLCAFDRNPGRVVCGRLFLSALDGKTYYHTSDGKEPIIRELTQDKEYIETDGIKMSIRVHGREQ